MESVACSLYIFRESVPLLQADFHSARQTPVLRGKLQQLDQEKMSVALFMLLSPPSWCRLVVMLLSTFSVLLAVVQRCILMDMSKNEVSSWQCSEEPVSQARWNRGKKVHIRERRHCLNKFASSACLSPTPNLYHITSPALFTGIALKSGICLNCYCNGPPA